MIRLSTSVAETHRSMYQESVFHTHYWTTNRENQGIVITDGWRSTPVLS
jgi:hypothetical protein